MSKDANLPTGDELERAWSSTASVVEATETLLGNVHRFINESAVEAPRAVTYADIGAILEWSEALAFLHEDACRRLRNAQRAALIDLAAIRRDGHLGSLPQFDEHGFSNYTDEGMARYVDGVRELISEPGAN